MFERFTERARQVVVLAQDEARHRNHQHIGTEHLLLGLLREEEGLAARVLEGVGVTYDKVSGPVSNIQNPEAVAVVPHDETEEQREAREAKTPFTGRCRKVLELALREALSLGHNYIGTEHILLGLLRENEGVAVCILRDIVDRGRYANAEEQIRNRVIEMLIGEQRSREQRMRPDRPSREQRMRPGENGGIRYQHVEAILSHLIGEGTPAEQVYDAVSYALDLKPGESISGGDHLIRAFVGEQMTRLTRG
jgi:ATP-dependent Clp protease ATP-binding subunit ClpC